MKILITGVTGFVGGSLLRLLGETKRDRPSMQLIATARRSQLSAELARWADVYFPADLSEGCPPVSASVCIHAAGLADDRSTAMELHRANVVATRHLLEALQDCRLFVFISSASVYGFKDGPMRERDATGETASSEYGRSKWAAEQSVREICGRRGIACVILRPRAIYGVGDRVLLPRLLRLMRPPFLFMIGKGLAPVSLTHIGHLAELIMALVFAEHPPERDTFNVADSETYQLRAVLTSLYAAIHCEQPRAIRIPVRVVRVYLAILEALGRTGALSRQSLAYLTEPALLDCTLARDTLHYAPATTFADHVSTIGRDIRVRMGVQDRSFTRAAKEGATNDTGSNC
jgi:nucleoside-diphosphate-sugar epimerase